MTRSFASAASTVVLLMLSAGAARAQQPLGFERFTVADVATGVDFGLTELEVFEKYAAELPLLGNPNRPIHGQKDKRLIDIEIRPDGSGLAVYVYDVVWVQNTGSFQLDSWFLPDLTEQEVKSLERLEGVVILDIERYPRGSSWRYSVILQRNTDDTPWKLLLDVSIHTIVEEMIPPGPPPYFRPVDIDVTTAKDENIFDAVLIQRVGVNNVVYVAPLVLQADVTAGFYNGIHQLVDQELVGGSGSGVFGTYMNIFVDSGLNFTTAYELTQQQVEANHVSVGRVVDLEGRLVINSPQSNEMRYYTVHLDH
jgi:hypothetical protein